MLRSGSAITVQLMSGAFPYLIEQVLENLDSRWDFTPAAQASRRLIAERAQHLTQRFLAELPLGLDLAIDRLISTSGRPAWPAAFDADQMVLLDDQADPVAEHAAACARRMQGRLDDGFKDMHVIVEFLSSRNELSRADNPFSPQHFTTPLLLAARDLELEPVAWVYFLQAFENDLAGELRRIYQALIDHFRLQGVDVRAVRRSRYAQASRDSAAASREGITPAAVPQAGVPAASTGTPAAAVAARSLPEGAAGAGMVAAGSGAAAMSSSSRMTGISQPAPAQAMAGAANSVPASGTPSGSITFGADAGFVLQELIAKLQANVAGTQAAPDSVNLSGQASPALLNALSELQSLGLEGVHGAVFAGTSAGSINAWREHLIAQSDRTVDKLTIEIVGMMFDHVMRDEQVPSEIKALISRLQFPILKAALLDAEFFASSAHPARRLIDRVASAAIGWEPYGDDNLRFRAEVERLVGEVILRFDRDLTLFDHILEEFDSFLSESGPRDVDPISRAQRALEEAEKREVLNINTTIQVRRVFDLIDMDDWMRNFLLGPWVQVLVEATLRDAQTPGFSKAFRESMHELLWSVKPKATIEERQRLLQMIPILTRTLRDGLNMIRMPQHDQEEFLQRLMQSHAFAVKPTDQASFVKHSVQAEDLRRRINDMEVAESFPLTAVPGGMRVTEAAIQRAASEHDVALTVPLIEAADEDDEPLDRATEIEMDQGVEQWKRGNWFELWNGSDFVKARLRWVSPLRTMFMFSSGADGHPHVLSPEQVRTYLKKNQLRPLDPVPLTQRVANAVVADFSHPSGDAARITTRVGLG